jgi:hypothetical protein
MSTSLILRSSALVLLLAALSSGQVLINELDTDVPDTLELFNTGLAPVNIGGWRIENGATNPSLTWITETYVLPGGVTIAAGGFVVITEGSVGVPPGTPVYTDPNNIPWPTAGPGSRGGDCVLVNGSNQGVDMIIWNNPAGANNFFGATFNGMYLPASATFHRNSNTDTDTSADWTTGGLSLGQVNPGQVDPTLPLLTLTVSTNGQGSLQWDVVSGNPPSPGVEIFNLVSLEDWTPDGSGPLFGIGFDALHEFATPQTTPGVFHTSLDPGGAWSLSVAGGIPAGIHAEFVSITVGPGGPDRISSVASVTF